MKKKVLVAMSGGVDSSVAAALLKREGFEIIGATIEPVNLDEHYSGFSKENGCTTKGAVEDARMICDELGIRHLTVNFSKTFKENVIDYFIDDYMDGNTPNPCVACNPIIKWGELIKTADEHGADFIATGHYAKISQIENDGLKRFALIRGKDLHKDQSYFLWRLSQEQLARTIFPLGDIDKTKTRELAAEFNLSVQNKPESQEICFIADDDYRNFLRTAVPDIDDKIGKGDIVLDGKVLGKHDGYPFYTIGQRRGLGISYAEPLYVKDINPETNTIIVDVYNEILDSGCIADTVNFMKYSGWQGEREFLVKIRYKHAGEEAICKLLDDGRLKVLFNEKIRAVTPGQSLVMYEGDVLVGGAVIREVIK